MKLAAPGPPQPDQNPCSRSLLPAGSIESQYQSDGDKAIRPGDAARRYGGAAMSHYKSNLRDIEFNLFEVLRRQDLLGQAALPGPRRGDRARHPRRARAAGDRPAGRVVRRRRPEPAGLRPGHALGAVPESLRKSYRAFMDAEWYRLSLPAELGGTERARSLNWAMAEMILGANPSIWMYASGHTHGPGAVGPRHAGAEAVRRAGHRGASGARPWC